MRVREYKERYRLKRSVERRLKPIQHQFTVRRSFSSYAPIIFVPICLINLFNVLFKDENEVIVIIYICFVFAFATIAIYMCIWIINHKDDPIIMEVNTTNIKVGKSEYKIEEIKSIKIMDKTVYINLKKSWKLNHYILDQNDVMKIVNLLEGLATTNKIKFKLITR